MPRAVPSPTPAVEPVRFKEVITGPGQTILKDPIAAASDNTTTTPATVPTAAVLPPSAMDARPPLLPPMVDPPLLAALRAQLEGRPDLASEHLRGFEPAQRELLSVLLPAVASARQGVADAQALENAAMAAGRMAPLRIKKACFASKVRQFGNYDPLPDGHHFLPGGMGQLYLELGHVSSLPTEHLRGGPGYVVRAECAVTVLDASGKSLHHFDKSNTSEMQMTEYTWSQVRDFFLCSEFPIPDKPGKYRVRVEVREQPSGRSIQHTQEFRVGRD
ncbi:MAG: hypothetical protein ACRCZF_18890 [Gemmataceae bacterium]